MNFELFFARRITFQGQRRISKLVIRLAIISIALAIATMEIAFSVVEGYQNSIQEKVVGFASHLKIGNYLSTTDTELLSLPKDEASINSLDTLGYVKDFYPFVENVGFFKSRETGIEDIWLKGIDSLYNWEFLNSILIEGELPNFDVAGQSREILISKKQARLIKVSTGDQIRLYFWDNRTSVKQRPVVISGIFETGMDEFDTRNAFCDIRMLQKVLNWEPNEVSGFAVNLTSLDAITEAEETINEIIPFNYSAEPVTRLYPDIFDWLGLLHQNVWLILILMCIVALINMTSVVLILIIERSNTIGILQALGLNKFRTRRLFVANALFLILVGVFLGNILGLGIIFSQDVWGWLKLDQENYFLNVAPVAWTWGPFLLVNIGTILVCTLFMFIPTLIISGNDSLMKVIRFQ